MLASSDGGMIKACPFVVAQSLLALESTSGKFNPICVIAQSFRASLSSPDGTWAQKELVGVQGDRGKELLVLSWSFSGPLRSH